MTTDQPRKRLPANPSIEHLRKEAKRLSRKEDVLLSEAQRRLADDYGFSTWSKLVKHIEGAKTGFELPDNQPQSSLSVAARAGDLNAVQRLLVKAPEDRYERRFWQDEIDDALWQACAGGPSPSRVAVAAALIDAGAQARKAFKGAPALCVAAANGPLQLVELLIRSGAKEWQADDRRRLPLHYARHGTAPDREAIARVLDRPVIDDPVFRAAVKAIQDGDVMGLNALLDRHPDLLNQRAKEPDCYGNDYFRDPKLFWFIANNPNLTPKMPPNILATTRALLDRRVEQADKNYALELVMTSAPARRARVQIPLMRLLLTAGARASNQALVATLGHRELKPIEVLLKAGQPLTAPVAAGLGLADDLSRLLKQAIEQDIHAALSMAVINDQVECAELCLQAGADANAFMAAHSHATPGHQAALNGNLDMLRLLFEDWDASGNIRDKLWGGSAFDWACYGKHDDARDFLADHTRWDK